MEKMEVVQTNEKRKNNSVYEVTKTTIVNKTTGREIPAHTTTAKRIRNLSHGFKRMS